MSNYTEKPCITRFREYLRIETVQPSPDYGISLIIDEYSEVIFVYLNFTGSCVEFLRRLAKEMNLTSEVVEFEPGMPIVLMTWPGNEPDLPTVLLNSHTDVVPVFKVNQHLLSLTAQLTKTLNVVIIIHLSFA